MITILENFNDTLSNSKTVVCGVPQGSILGPLLFLAYVNDMKAAVNWQLLLYADDSAIIVSGKNITEIENSLSKELESVQDWLIDNKLSLHLGKTEAIVFGSKHKVSRTRKMNVTCKGTNINNTDTVTYLGAIIDSCLTGEHMAERVLKKVNSRLKFLFRKSRYLTRKTKKLLYNSLIQCHYDYSCSFWYSSITQKTKNKIQITQNKAIRLILGLPFRSHLDHHIEFKNLNILPIEHRVAFIKICQMHKIYNNVAPTYLLDEFNKISHGHNTRYCANSYEKVSKDTTFKYTGSNLWNNIPNSLKMVEKYDQFKTGLRDHIWGQIVQKSNQQFINN